MNCAPCTVEKLISERLFHGRSSKKVMCCFAFSRIGSLSAMLMAFKERSAGLKAGQTSTHKLQPVQSST